MAIMFTTSPLSKNDLADSAVHDMLELIQGSPALCEQKLDDKLHAATMGDADLRTRQEARRARLALKAKEDMAKLAELPPEERSKLINDGDLSHYTPEEQVNEHYLCLRYVYETNKSLQQYKLNRRLSGKLCTKMISKSTPSSISGGRLRVFISTG